MKSAISYAIQYNKTYIIMLKLKIKLRIKLLINLTIPKFIHFDYYCKQYILSFVSIGLFIPNPYQFLN